MGEALDKKLEAQKLENEAIRKVLQAQNKKYEAWADLNEAC